MRSATLRAIARICVLTLGAVLIWLAGREYNGLPQPRGDDAPAVEFSAARADLTLSRILGPEIPHPLGSNENANVRGRIQEEFKRLGVNAVVYQAFACNGHGDEGYVACAAVTDIIAEVVPGDGKAVVMLAHYDSVPAGPGAADDASGVATIIETARALKARGIAGHPVLAVLTDGEEAGMLGARAFLDNAALKARVGVVVNMEARGNQGPSLLFQTSPGDGKLIDLYARGAKSYATSSLFAPIYKLLPNDTDLTLFLAEAMPGLNFAFIGDGAQYHTVLDRRGNLNPSTLQHHGDNALGAVSALMSADLTNLKGSDEIYLSLFGHWLPHLPVAWALPLAIVALLLTIAAIFQLAPIDRGELWRALIVPPLLPIGCGSAGWAVHSVAAVMSGHDDPSYAYPLPLRIALAFSALAVIVICARPVRGKAAFISIWLWMSVLGVVAAAAMPGLSPYFLLPALAGGVAVLTATYLGARCGEALMLLAALAALAIWLSFAALGEGLMGLHLHLLFTLPIALGGMTALPLLRINDMSRRAWLMTVAGCAVVTIATAILAGAQPPYSARTPQRLNITFVDDHIAGKALWAVDTPDTLPTEMRRVEGFSPERVRVLLTRARLAYVAPAGDVRYTAPMVAVDSALAGDRWRVAVHWQASPQADVFFLMVPRDAGLLSVEAGDKSFAVPKAMQRSFTLVCHGDGCNSKDVVLELARRKPVELTIGEQRYGLPTDGAALLAARPAAAVPSGVGDSTILLGRLALQ